MLIACMLMCFLFWHHLSLTHCRYCIADMSKYKSGKVCDLPSSPPPTPGRGKRWKAYILLPEARCLSCTILKIQPDNK